MKTMKARALAENFPGGPTKNHCKLAKKYRKIAPFSLLFQRRANGKKDKKIP